MTIIPAEDQKRKAASLAEEQRKQAIKAAADTKKQNALKLLRVKLSAVIQGYKTRRILTRHCTMRVLKKEYYDLLAFTFGLQHEMRQSKHSVSAKTKSLMV